ncbi:MAG: hypothetical protein ACREGA_02690 [Candidatus Saccharimonadales bacterium]
MLYLFSVLSGLFAANGVPHFVKGVTGQRHQTPFGKGSSAAINVAWGWINLVVAVIFIHYAHPHLHLFRAFGCFAVAGLAMAVLLAQNCSAHPENNTPKK